MLSPLKWRAAALFVLVAHADAQSTSCSDACSHVSDGWCDDGGPGAEFSFCPYGTDCTDCGVRTSSSSSSPPPSPSPPPPAPGSGATSCSNTCLLHGSDGECDDGGPGAEFSLCPYGTDCTDCGVRSGSASSSGSSYSSSDCCPSGLAFCYSYTGHCGAFGKDSNCWVTDDLCLASDSGKCCDLDTGPFVAVTAGGAVAVILAIIACVVACPCCNGCPCNKFHNRTRGTPQQCPQGQGVTLLSSQPGTVPVVTPVVMPVATPSLPAYPSAAPIDAKV